MSQTIFSPETWLESLVRGLKDYVVNNLDTDVYDVVMEFPGPMFDSSKMPLDKSVIHFEADDIGTSPLGMGDEPLLENYDPGNQSVNPQWGAMHSVNFDVGVWTSDRSGGTTSRMRAMQILNQLFGFPSSVIALRDATTGDDGGVEITSYSGGRFALDHVNDVRVYRMVGGQLQVRVFSRVAPLAAPAPAIEEITQVPNLTILG